MRALATWRPQKAADFGYTESRSNEAASTLERPECTAPWSWSVKLIQTRPIPHDRGAHVRMTEVRMCAYPAGRGGRRERGRAARQVP